MKAFFLFLFLLAGLASAYYEIQDEYTDRTCALNRDGSATCLAGFSGSQRFMQITEVTDDGRGNRTDRTFWDDITNHLKFKYWNGNTTFTISDDTLNKSITLTPIVKTASGQLRSFDFLRDAGVFESLNFTLERQQGYHKFGFGMKWYANISEPQALGFYIDGDDGTYGYSNGTITFFGRELDLRPLHREGWRFTFINRTTILFRHDAQFARRTVVVDPYIQLNSNATGSQSDTINVNSSQSYNQLGVSTQFTIGKDVLAISQTCGASGSTRLCKGYVTYNVSQIPANATVNAINLSLSLVSEGILDDGLFHLVHISRASPYYNNNTNASNFIQWTEIGGTVNYTNLTFESVGNTLGFYNFTLSTSTNDTASDDLERALNGTHGVFRNNFTVGVLLNDTTVFNFGGVGGGANAPIMYVSYTTEAPFIFFVPNTPENATFRGLHNIPVNVTTSSWTNHSAWVDFNRSLLEWWAFDFFNVTHFYDNSSYLRNAAFASTNFSASRNVSQGSRGNAVNLLGLTNNYLLTGSYAVTLNEGASICAWVYIRNCSVNLATVWKRQLQLEIRMDSPNCVITGRAYNSTSGSGSTQNTFSNAIQKNEWVHICMVQNVTRLSKNVSVKVYVNGGLNKTTVTDIQARDNIIGLTGSKPSYIGVDPDLTTRLFNGSIDEVMFWNRELGPKEVNTSFEAGMWRLTNTYENLNNTNYTIRGCVIDAIGSTNCTENRTIAIFQGTLNISFAPPTPNNGSSQTANFSYINTSINATNNYSAWIDFNRSLLAYWAMDWNNASGILDNSTYGTTMKYAGAGFSQTSINASIRGLGLTLDGSNDQLIISSTTTQHLNITPNFTITMWANPIASIANMRLFTRMEASGNFVQISKPATDLYAQFYYQGIYYNASSTIGTLPTLQWNHLAVVFNGTGTTMYLNGRKINTVTTLASMSAPTQGTNFMTIGSRSDNSSYFQGSMDEVMIFNRSLTAQEVNASFEGSMYRLERNFTELGLGNYTVQACAIDQEGTSNCTENRTFSITPTPPTDTIVTLISPPNGNVFINSQTMNFTASAVSAGGTLKNATLYINGTGVFQANQTNTTALANGSTYEIRGVPINNSLYSWNMFICDSTDTCNFATSNFTFRMTQQGPTVTLSSPFNGSISANNTVFMVGLATIINTTIHNASLYFGNATTVTLNYSIFDNSTTATFNLTVPVGQWYWNVGFCQANALCALAPANYTFTVITPLDSDVSSEGFILWFLMVASFFLLLGAFSPEMKILFKILIYWIASSFFIGATLALIILSQNVLPAGAILGMQLEDLLGMALTILAWPFYLILLFFVLQELYIMAKEGWKHGSKI